MKPRVYSIPLPDAGTISLVCDRTVVRFRSLPKGALFLIGEDEGRVYQKTGQMEVRLVASDRFDVALGASGDEKGNPWCEPLVEVKT